MTKRQLIDEIVSINHSAQPSFLAAFNDQELNEYLDHLKVLRTPRLASRPGQFDKYFKGCPTISQTQTPVNESVFSIHNDTFAREQIEDIDVEDGQPASSNEDTQVMDPRELAAVLSQGGCNNVESDNDTPFACQEEDSQSWLF